MNGATEAKKQDTRRRTLTRPAENLPTQYFSCTNSHTDVIPYRAKAFSQNNSAFPTMFPL